MRHRPERAAGRQAEAKRYVIDMAGRRVTLPGQVKRIVTLGPVPVLNSFIFALGEGEKIVNGLPGSFARSPRYRYQTLFAPSLAHEPDLQGNPRQDGSISRHCSKCGLT